MSLTKDDKTLAIGLILFYCIVLTVQIIYNAYDIRNLRTMTHYVENQNHALSTESLLLKKRFTEGSEYYKLIFENCDPPQ